MREDVNKLLDELERVDADRISCLNDISRLDVERCRIVAEQSQLHARLLSFADKRDELVKDIMELVRTKPT